MSIHDIERTERKQRYFRHRFTMPGYSDGYHLTGEDLTMKDGSVWFHPHNGSAPRQIR